ncbi:hypothetical protein DA2_1420 [Desulfovibrio sp. A2]|nr:hypothetical protein DA2_1420 [Desulfovibrio sp. A2]
MTEVTVMAVAMWRVGPCGARNVRTAGRQPVAPLPHAAVGVNRRARARAADGAPPSCCSAGTSPSQGDGAAWAGQTSA